MKKLLGIVVISLLLTNPAWSVSCDGWDSNTSAWVWGDCTSGSFDGYDSNTNAYVYGDCTPGGDLSAWNSDTGSWVWGDCDS